MQRVWNITDDANPEVAPRMMMVLGTNVKPGKSVRVDESRLARAHKVHANVAAGLLFIGDQPPYLKARKPVHVKLAKGVGRAHGKLSVKPALEEAATKVDLVDQVKADETFAVVMSGDAGDDTIAIVREFRDATGAELKDAADKVKAGGVRSLGSDLTRESADELAKRLKDAGADVEVLTVAEASAKVEAAKPEETSSGKRNKRRR
jgi:ribosomal protein L7/L12